VNKAPTSALKELSKINDSLETAKAEQAAIKSAKLNAAAELVTSSSDGPQENKKQQRPPRSLIEELMRQDEEEAALTMISERETQQPQPLSAASATAVQS
jgi:hypothetical protein